MLLQCSCHYLHSTYFYRIAAANCSGSGYPTTVIVNKHQRQTPTQCTHYTVLVETCPDAAAVQGVCERCLSSSSQHTHRPVTPWYTRATFSTQSTSSHEDPFRSPTTASSWPSSVRLGLILLLCSVSWTHCASLELVLSLRRPLLSYGYSYKTSWMWQAGLSRRL